MLSGVVAGTVGTGESSALISTFDVEKESDECAESEVARRREVRMAGMGSESEETRGASFPAQHWFLHEWHHDNPSALNLDLPA